MAYPKTSESSRKRKVIKSLNIIVVPKSSTHSASESWTLKVVQNFIYLSHVPSLSCKVWPLIWELKWAFFMENTKVLTPQKLHPKRQENTLSYRFLFFPLLIYVPAFGPAFPKTCFVLPPIIVRSKEQSAGLQSPLLILHSKCVTSAGSPLCFHLFTQRFSTKGTWYREEKFLQRVALGRDLTQFRCHVPFLFYSTSTKSLGLCNEKWPWTRIQPYFRAFRYFFCLYGCGRVCVWMLPSFYYGKSFVFLVRRTHYASVFIGAFVEKGDDLKHVCVGGCIFVEYRRWSCWLFMPKWFYEKRPSATLNETCKSKQLPWPSSVAAVNLFSGCRHIFRLENKA